jgi:hypothetical protein
LEKAANRPLRSDFTSYYMMLDSAIETSVRL